MKLKIVITFLGAVLVSGCSNFLNIAPQNFISSENFFETEADFVQAVNATYAPLRTVYNQAYVMGEMRSDNAHYLFNNSNRGNLVREEIADFINNSTAEPAAVKWSGNFRIIAYANEVISRIDEASFIAETVRQNLKGQVLFLRALAYFDLVQYFGDVPLMLTPTAGSADEILDVKSTLPRTPKVTIYEQIVQDGELAASLLPGKAVQEKGRATAGAAKTLLAHVAVVQQQWDKAENLLLEIVNSGEYSLLADYAAVFDPGNKNHAESIFEVQYQQGNLGLQSTFTYTFLPNLTNLSPIAGFQFNNQSIGGWNIPSEDLIAAYETGDKRKAAAITDGYTAADGTFVPQPFIKKYVHLPLPAPNGSSANGNDNWPVYRYADVLLLLAESLNEQGKSGAAGYLNQVRSRAFDSESALITESDPGQLRDLIAKERRIELAFENKRWLDLVRTGRAIETMNAYGAALKASGKHPNLIPQTYQVDANKLLFPIPFNEIKVNPNLEQNPGY